MIVLAVGDVTGKAGLEYLRKVLPGLKKSSGAELCIVNGENSADGNGITKASAEHIFLSGADVITTGNHVYRRKEVYSFLDESPFVLRPANYSERNPGHGSCIVDTGRCRVRVINLMGNIYMGEALSNPFLTADRLLEEDSDCKLILVDFHAEATSEKRALGFYLDGRVSAVFGTHTHVQTADEQILCGGTGYITDLGMTGTADSVLGVSKDIVIEKMKYNMPARFNFSNDGGCVLNGCLFHIDDKSGRTLKVERIRA